MIDNLKYYFRQTLSFEFWGKVANYNVYCRIKKIILFKIRKVPTRSIFKKKFK